MRALALSCIVAIASQGCVMPQHRAAASVVNGAVAATSIAALVAIRSDEANPNSLKAFDHESEEAFAGLLVVGILAELASFALHQDAPAMAAPVNIASAPLVRGNSALTTLRVTVP